MAGPSDCPLTAGLLLGKVRGAGMACCCCLLLSPPHGDITQAQSPLITALRKCYLATELMHLKGSGEEGESSGVTLTWAHSPSPPLTGLDLGEPAFA